MASPLWKRNDTDRQVVRQAGRAGDTVAATITVVIPTQLPVSAWREPLVVFGERILSRSRSHSRFILQLR